MYASKGLLRKALSKERDQLMYRDDPIHRAGADSQIGDRLDWGRTRLAGTGHLRFWKRRSWPDHLGGINKGRRDK